MKKTVIALFLAIVMAISFSACGEFAAMKPAEPYSSAEKEPIVIPEAVANLTAEDEKLLNGELKDGVYINRYFGIKFSVPKDWTLTRLNDDVTESTELYPLRRAYEEEMNGLAFMTNSDSFDGYIEVYITALKDDERGLSEEALVKKDIDDMWKINKIFGDDEGPAYETVMLAGEEHPVSVSRSESDAGERIFATLSIPKGDFKYDISISATNTKLEDLTRFFEKI